jgi:uncharacterized protein (TIGR03083 family)
MGDADRLYTGGSAPTSTHYHRRWMRPTFTAPPDCVEVLAAECRALAAAVLSLPEEDFARGTRCPPWDVKALLAHVWRGIDRIIVYTAEPAPERIDSDAIAYFRGGYDPVADAADVAARGLEVADRFATGADLARDFDERSRRIADVARSMAAGRAVRTFGPCLRLDEYVCTRVLEVAVHGLDLADALGRDPWLTPGGAALVRSMLVAMLGAEPPEALGWDDAAFFETGTGRRRPSTEERRILGPLADELPLLS